MNIAVMGDSMSTFEEWSNNAVNRNDHTGNYYPTNSNFKSVDNMWWMQVYNQIGGTQLVSVDAIGGSCVGYYENSDSGHLGPSWCFDTDTRAHDLGSPDVNSGKRPDVILLFGGVNDLCQPKYDSSTFILHYKSLLHRIYNYYTHNPCIMCITPFTGYLSTSNPRADLSDMVAAIDNIVVEFRFYGYDCKFVSMKDLLLTYDNGNCDKGEHPNASGMKYIADRVVYIWKNAYH